MRPLLIAALLVTALGCANAPVRSAPRLETATLDVDGQERSYRLMIPAVETGRTMPLVIVLHDAFGDAASIATTTEFDREASAGGFAAVYPESVFGLWNGLYCCGEARRLGIADLDFLDALLDRLLAEEPVDPDRVHVTGVSNGGVMALAMGCAMSERVTAVAAVAATFDLSVCTSAEPVSALAINGTGDTQVPYEGGDLPGDIESGPAPSLPELMAAWAATAGCGAGPTTTREDPVRRDSWSGCAEDARVELITLDGGGHTWFASEFGGANGAVDATEEITAFFDLR